MIGIMYFFSINWKIEGIQDTTPKQISMWKKFEKWFDLNLGWFFINGRKQDAWHQHLREKYGEK